MIRDLSEYQPRKISSETGYAVKYSEVVWADYNRILSDFFGDSLKKKYLSSKTQVEALLDSWILEQFSFVSKNQFENTLANEPIVRGHGEKEMFRLPRYNRAAVFQAHAPSEIERKDFRGGFADVKGCGIATPGIPENLSHKTGLITLAEALSEFLMQSLIDGIFRIHDFSVSSVPIYAIISLGFNAIEPSSGAITPAALIIRRSHLRENSGNELPMFGTPQYKVYLEVERALRCYGLSSSSVETELSIWKEYGELKYCYGGNVDPRITSKHLIQFTNKLKIKPPLTISCTNFQTTTLVSSDPIRVELVDFGHYDFFVGEPKPFAVLVDDRPLNIGEVIVDDTSLELLKKRDLWKNNSVCNIEKVPNKSLTWLNTLRDTSDFGLLRPAIRLSRIIKEKRKPKEFLDSFITRYVNEFTSVHQAHTKNNSKLRL